MPRLLPKSVKDEWQYLVRNISDLPAPNTGQSLPHLKIARIGERQRSTPACSVQLACDPDQLIGKMGIASGSVFLKRLLKRTTLFSLHTGTIGDQIAYTFDEMRGLLQSVLFSLSTSKKFLVYDFSGSGDNLLLSDTPELWKFSHCL